MLRGEPRRAIGCFDWDPFVAMLGDEIMMVKQDVGAMMTEVFRQVESGISGTALTEIPVQLMA
ncbi:Uncharacterised protein [Serratia rubidaea]|nr:Uncharacterised protein [Serratia rubidaea]